jgi:general secretion pathway protein A
MYNEHFGFRESPFSAAPSPRFFYTNDQYQEALANLRYGIEWKKGLIVMTGEVGTGKTTLLDKTMCSLGATTHAIFVSYNHLTYTELLRLISKELGLADAREDRLAAMEQLRECLLAQRDKGHIVALLIDEAQGLSDEMFEDIRFLSNMETREEKLLQIVLTGQPELERRLDALKLRNIKQRVVVHCRLASLQQDEVSRYIDTRLRQAGYEGKELFHPEAVDHIATCTAGIPRLINIVCDNALLLAFAQSKKNVTSEMVQEVARDLRLKAAAPHRSQMTLPLGLIENDGERPPISDSAASEELLAARAQPFPPHTSSSARMFTGAISVMLTVAVAGGIFVWTRASDLFHRPPASEPPSLIAGELANEISQSMTPAKNVTATETVGEDLPWPPTKIRSSTPKAERRKIQDEPVAAKEKKTQVGNFAVSGPSSFMRNTPRSDAKIIATLESGTEVKVLSRRGNYFRVQATVDGQPLRGYVHREDAFFERINKDGQRETLISEQSR